MVSADMCKHDWPGSSCPDCRKEAEEMAKMARYGEDPVIPPPVGTSMAAATGFGQEAEARPRIPRNTTWEYKEVRYRVQDVWDSNLSQDPETGKWEPTVRYKLVPPTELTFHRTVTEWLRKFTRVTKP
jgi:hypothetical protein